MSDSPVEKEKCEDYSWRADQSYCSTSAIWLGDESVRVRDCGEGIKLDNKN